MSNALAKIARSIFWPLYVTGCWVCLVIFEGVLGLSVALGVRVAVNKVMGSRGRRNRSHRRWGQYSHGQRNWPIGMAGRVNGAMRGTLQHNGKRKGHGKTQYSNPTTCAASLFAGVA